jgi:tetratricopeptide (TPR) repeat protein
MGRTPTDTLTAILRDRPASARDHNPEVPDELQRVIGKCLEKDPRDRYQHADEIVVDLRKLRRDTDSQPLPRVSDDGARAVRSRPAWLRPALIAGAGALLVAVVLVGWWLLPTRSPTGAEVESLAVLPLVNLKDPGDPERLGQILQELIIADLSGLGSVKVFSSERLLDIRRQLGGGQGGTIDPEMAPSIAERAGATTMLTGSLSQLGDRRILTYRLVNVADGSVLNSDRIPGADVYTMVDSLTGRIRSALVPEQTEEGKGELAVKDRTTGSIEAYQRYLAGIELLNDAKFAEAMKELEAAIEIDPMFGRAHLKLAIATWWENPEGWFGSAQPEQDALNRALSDEVRLTRKERLLAEALRPLLEKRYEDGVPLFEELVREYPDEKEAWYGLGEAHYHAGGGDKQRALEAFLEALGLDPSFTLAFDHAPYLYHQVGRHRDGIEKVKEYLQRSPNKPYWYRAWVELAIYAGDTIEAEKAIEQAMRRVDDPEERRRLLIYAASRYQYLVQGRGRAEELYRSALEVEAKGDEDQALRGLGWVLAARRDYQGADEIFRRAMTIDPDNWQSRLAVLNSLSEARRYEDVNAYAKELLVILDEKPGLVEEDPGYLWLYPTWVGAAISLGDEEETERAIEDGLRHCTTDRQKARLLQQVSFSYRELGNWSKSAEAMIRARGATPDPDEDPDLAVQSGRHHLIFGELERAAEFYGKVPEDDDYYWSVLNGMVEIQQRRGDHDAAIAYAKKLFDRSSREPPGENLWSPGIFIAAHLCAGGTAEADEILEDTLAESRLGRLPYDWQRRELLGHLAWAYLWVGVRPERAEELLRRAEALDPAGEDLELYRRLGEVLAYEGRYGEAEKELGRALSIDPHDEETQEHLAALSLLRQDHAAAETELRAQMEGHAPRVGALWLLAIALVEQGRHEEAERIARQAVEMSPTYRSYNLLGWVLVAGGIDLDGGIKMARKARAFPLGCYEKLRLPFEPEPEHTLGLAYLKKGNREKAIEWLEKAQEKRPDRALIAEHLREARAQKPS